MYFCAEHQIAFATPKQWSGHHLHEHPGESRPKAEDVFVEQVPEGTKIVSAPANRPTVIRERRPATDPNGTDPPPRAPSAPSVYVDEDEIHLDQLLDGIGVPPPQRQTIVKGWRNFPVLHQHPANLENYIVGILGAKFRQSVPLVVHSMFPGTEQEDSGSQYLYGHPPYGRPAPMYWDGRQPRGYRRDWEPEPPPYDYRYSRPRPDPESAEANPQVVALQKQVDGILGELQAERAERAREREEQKEKDRDAAWQAQLNTIGTKTENTFRELGDMVKGLSDQIQRGQGVAEASQGQQLSEQVATLTRTIADQREAQLQGSVDSLRSELGDVRQKLSAESTGKTTEDLAALGIPLAIAELRNVGAAAVGELKGIRTQAAEGKLPILAPPPAPNPGKVAVPEDPVKTAQQIAGARVLEDEILSAAGAG